MRWFELVGFAAFLTNVWGNWLLVQKSERGWWVRIISIILWFVYARESSSWAMTANSITFFFINVVGLVKWRRERLRTGQMKEEAVDGLDHPEGEQKGGW